MEYNERRDSWDIGEFETSIKTFNMSVLRQLEEIFPDLAVDFLKDICDSYKEETIDLDILTELVLSFECPPLKKSDKHKNLEELTINSATEKTSRKVNIYLIGLQNGQNNESLTSPSEDNRKSIYSGKCNKSKINSNINKTNSISVMNESNSFNQQINGSTSDKENCFQYTLENTFLMDPNKLFEEKIEVFKEDVKDIDHNIDDELVSKEDYSSSVDFVIIEDDDLNEGIKHEPRQNKSSNERSPSLGGQTSPNKRSRQPLFRSCKVKYSEKTIINKKNPQARKSNKERQKVKHGKTLNSDNLSKFDTTESKYVLLSKVFPNANSDYLLSQCQKVNNQEELLIFISQTLDSRNYPIKETQTSVESINTFDCTIEQFLEEYPDPITVFSNDSYTRTGYEQNAEIYLSSRYQSLDPEVMTDLLKEHNYNLTTLCAELEVQDLEPNPCCLDHLSFHHPPSVFFHQEVWFIEHKTEIQNLLASVLEAVKVEEEFNKPAILVDEVFECVVCSEEISEYSELGSCDKPTGHLFCKKCIKRSIEIQFGEGSTTFPCLANCGGFIDLPTVKELLPEEKFGILMNKIQEEEIRIANIPGVETCPFCHFAYGPDEEDILFICENPTCMKKSCRVCREEDHSPNVCTMFENENEETARHYIEKKMTEALVRQCYKCGKHFVKETGCNKMTCTCGALMCYLCRKPVEDYTHFNGQGGDNFDRCELFSEEKTIHDQPVATSAEEAFNELIANNPGINLDANKIIPK